MKDESKTDVVVTTYDALKSGMYIQLTNLSMYYSIHQRQYSYTTCIYVRYAQCLPPLGVAQHYPRRGA